MYFIQQISAKKFLHCFSPSIDNKGLKKPNKKNPSNGHFGYKLKNTNTVKSDVMNVKNLVIPKKS